MAQVGAARGDAQTDFCGHRNETQQCPAKALLFRIARPLSDVEPVDEKSVANICGIISPIEAPIVHQHVKAVDPAS